MNVLFYGVSKCSYLPEGKKSGCRPMKFLFEDRHIKDDRPTASELKEWIARAGFRSGNFNTSGMVYKELGLKDKLPNMSEDEMIEVLASDGMVVKRPLIVGSDFVLVGFKEQEWEAAVRLKADAGQRRAGWQKKHSGKIRKRKRNFPMYITCILLFREKGERPLAETLKGSLRRDTAGRIWLRTRIRS